MIKGLLRLLATISLALAVVMVVADAARSLAADAVTLTALASAWGQVHGASLEQARLAIETYFPAAIANMITNNLFAAPAFVIFGVLALILYAGGHKRPRPKRQFTSA